MTDQRRITLSTGITLNVATAGPAEAPAVILLHGFPESHRTWRELVPDLARDLRLVMPDQRGFGASDQPQDVADYATDRIVDDIFALADSLGIDRFALVGHDWGGAVAWAAAIKNDPRLTRLAIVNAPHPVIFQKSLIEDADQRQASQYITAFRTPGIVEMIQGMGWETFFEKTFGGHLDSTAILSGERAAYIADWSRPGAMNAMLNWYRAAAIMVPAPGVTVPIPDFLLRAFPKIHVPTLVVWGMRDKALLPLQLDGLDTLVDDLMIERIDAGHFCPWEAPAPVLAALGPFLRAAQAA